MYEREDATCVCFSPKETHQHDVLVVLLSLLAEIPVVANRETWGGRGGVGVGVDKYYLITRDETNDLHHARAANIGDPPTHNPESTPPPTAKPAGRENSKPRYSPGRPRIRLTQDPNAPSGILLQLR